MVLVVLAVGAAGGTLWWAQYGRAWWRARTAQGTARATCTVKRGDLPISLTASGSLKALRSEVYKSRVEGRSTIIRIVDEGTIITPQDVKGKKLLVELDSAELRDRLTQQEITFATSEAGYTQAKEAYVIEESKGKSNITKATLDVKFSRMDLQREVGEGLAADVLAGKVELLKLADALSREAAGERRTIEAEAEQALKQVDQALREAAERVTSRTAEGGGPVATNPHSGGNPHDAARARVVKMPRMASVTQGSKAGQRLGGAALQSKRKLEGDIDLAIEEFKRAADKLIWTAKLESEGFVSHNELEADQLAVKRELINLEQALAARELFLRYELPKSAEQLLSVYRENGAELERVQAQARASLAQKSAELSSKKATYERNQSKLEKLRDQIARSRIYATKPGIVIYASSSREHWRHRSSGRIEEGASVYERQEIIRMPDLSSIAVGVGIHESVIDKVSIRLPADIRVDAFPKLRLTGRVHKIGVLPTPQAWWNPGVKEYDVDITIEGDHPDLKPGMTAQVELHVRTLKNVLMVPVQAVAARRGKRVVYVVRGQGEEAREVELGESNDQFVQVRKGLREGEVVLLEAPQMAPGVDEQEEEDEEEEPQKPTEPEMPDGGPPGPPSAGPTSATQPGALRPGAKAGPPRPGGRPGPYTGQRKRGKALRPGAQRPGDLPAAPRESLRRKPRRDPSAGRPAAERPRAQKPD